jgi:hypothetical protein
MVNQEEMLGVLLAYSATWQTLLGAADATEALAKVRSGQAEDAGDNAVTYPRAIIEEVERERTSKATRTFAGRGALLLTIEAQPPDDQVESVDTQRAWFKAMVDAIELEMRDTSSSRSTPAGYDVSHFQIKTMSWSVEPFLVPEVEREGQAIEDTTPAKPLWAVQFRVEY